MALHDEILRAIRDGKVPRRFKTGDLKKIPGSSAGRYIVGSGEYSENAIDTIPRNHSVRPDGSDPGDYVRRGRKPAFFWYGRGEYELILDHEHYLGQVDAGDLDPATAEGNVETLTRSKPSERSHLPLPIRVDDSRVLRIADQASDPATIIVRYIAEHPFQAYYRRAPVRRKERGWGARLDAYFWPTTDQNWATTCRRVSSISSRIQRAIEELKTTPGGAMAADDLLDAFKCACVWGSVRLPEADPRCLAKEALAVVRALSGGREPPVACRLNSAWTKLYAFALPDTCVIYDSRVATALTSILDPVMHLISGSPKWQAYSRLGTVSGRGGSRPRRTLWKWPVGYSAWASQMAANLLCSKVVDELNRQSITQSDCRKSYDCTAWTLREVEAVLFMEGY